jgi:glycerophosphoryl diester phosphodiesterase
MILIAHRGMRSHSPENTLTAFRKALFYGFPHFELDVQLSTDGVCFVFHDDNADRRTNGSGTMVEVRQQAFLPAIIG